MATLGKLHELKPNEGSIGKNGTSNFTNASEWAWHVESCAWYAEVTGYTATTVHVYTSVHYWPARILRAQGEFLPSIKQLLALAF